MLVYAIAMDDINLQRVIFPQYNNYYNILHDFINEASIYIYIERERERPYIITAFP